MSVNSGIRVECAVCECIAPRTLRKIRMNIRICMIYTVFERRAIFCNTLNIINNLVFNILKTKLSFGQI